MTDATKKAIEEFANNLLTKKEIEIITGESRRSPEFCEAFERGLLLRKASLHKSINNLADAGSAPAQAMVRDIIRKNEYKE